MKRFLGHRLLCPLVLFTVSFVIYATFHSSYVYGGDAGDLLSAIAVRGVPHPSGYPLYTMLGIIFSFLPLPETLAWKVGLASALFSSLTVVVVYLLLSRLTKHRYPAFIASASLIFIFPFWLYAQITEVMALQHLFIATLLYLAVVYRQSKNILVLYSLAFICGLSLTNNQTILFAFPIIFLLSIGTLYKSGAFPKKLLLCIGLFLLGLLPYLYLPIAASFHPAVNWNNPSTLEGFLRVILRQDYGWTSTTVVAPSVKIVLVEQLFSYILTELTLFGILLCVFGIIYSFLQKKYRFVAMTFFLGFFLFGPFFIYYGGGPTFGTMSLGSREKFYASSLLFLIPFLAFGIEASMLLLRKLLNSITVADHRVGLYEKGFLIFVSLLPVILFFKNIALLDLRGANRITETFAKELLISLPKKTVVIAQNDNVLFSSWYVQFAQGVRNDVYVTSPVELKRLVRGGKLNLKPNPVTSALNYDTDPDNNLHSIALQLPTPVAVSESDYHGFVKDNKIIMYPHGLVLKYANAQERQMSKDSFLKKQDALLRQLSDPNDLITSSQKERLWLLSNFPLFYARAYTKTGFFLIYAYKDYSRARKYFQKAVTIDDRDHWAYEGLGITYYQQKNYKTARRAFEKAVAIEPLNHNAYFLLYGTTLALKDKASADELERFFKQYNKIYTDFHFEKTRVRVPR